MAMAAIGGAGAGAGILGLLGGVGQAVAQDWSDKKARRWASQESEKARTWQSYMANTAYQRGVVDMRSAGLNPILAATGGLKPAQSGAAPVVSGAPVGSPMFGGAWETARKGLSDAIRGKVDKDLYDAVTAKNVSKLSRENFLQGEFATMRDRESYVADLTRRKAEGVRAAADARAAVANQEAMQLQLPRLRLEEKFWLDHPKMREWRMMLEASGAKDISGMVRNRR